MNYVNSENQASIWRWCNATFPGTDPDSPRKSLRLLEEVVELCVASGANEEDITVSVDRGLAPFGWAGPGKFEPGKIPAKAADVLIVLYAIAGMRGFNLDDEADRMMAVNRARTWRALGDGTGYHVKEGGSP